MADKHISALPAITELQDDALLVAEQNGDAGKITGKQLKKLAQEGIDASVEAAKAARAGAEAAQSKAEQYKNAAEDSAQNAEESEMNAKTSETNAKQSENLARESEEEAEVWANLAHSYAEQATVPAVAGVYNVVLVDRVTGDKYALIVEDGRLILLGVSDTLEATELTIIDNSTGVSYAVVVEDGRLLTEEV